MPDPFSTPVADPFMDGGLAPGLTWPEVGDIRTIVVRKVTQRIDTKPNREVQTWDDGTPKNVYVFSGESGGEPASVWVRGNLVTVLREATKTAGLTSVVDTKITIQRLTDGTPRTKGYKAPHLFAAKVEPVAPVASDEEPF